MISSSKISINKQSTVKKLIQQILERKGQTRESKLTVCNSLKKTLLSFDVDNEFNCLDYIKDLFCVLSSNVSIEHRKVVLECIGVLGYLYLLQFDKYVNFLFDQLLKASTDSKTVILSALFHSLDLIGSRSKQTNVQSDVIEAIMVKMKVEFETNESPIVLIPLLDICLAISKYFPSIFKSHFEEVVDFTTGWYVDADQSNEVLNKCKNLLINLRPFWLNSISYTLNFLDQLVDDCILYLKGLTEVEEKTVGIIEKVSALLHALVTFIEIVNVGQPSVTLITFVETLIPRLADAVENLLSIEMTDESKLFVDISDVYQVALKINRADSLIAIVIDVIYKMIIHPTCVQTATIRLLCFYDEICDKSSPEHLDKILSFLIDEKNGILKRIQPKDARSTRIISRFYGKMLTPKVLSTLQTAYEFARKETLESISLLKKLPEENVDDIYQNEQRILMFLYSFTGLAVVKNSLIALMGLKPSFFTFVFSELPIVEYWFIKKHPTCHYALMYLAKLHTEKHDFFVANCSYVTEKLRLSAVNVESPTAGYLLKILETLAKLVDLNSYMWSDVRLMLSEWIYELVFGIGNDLLHIILEKKEMVKLRYSILKSFARNSLPKKSSQDLTLKSPNASSADSRFVSSRMRYFSLLRRLDVFNLLEEDGTNMSISFSNILFTSGKEHKKEKVLGLWQALPPAFFINYGLNRHGHMLETTQAKSDQSKLSAEHFKLIFDFLIKGEVPAFHLDSADDVEWIEQFVDTVFALNSDGFSENTPQSFLGKWRWCLMQTALYCIENRLKTHVGKATDTFSIIEKEIRNLMFWGLSNKPRVDDEQTKHIDSRFTNNARLLKWKKNANHGDVEKPEEYELSNSEHWFRVRSLLEMLEMLEKLINYSTNGGVFQLTNVSQASQTFFTTNSTTCLNWLSRMYIPLMVVAFLNGFYSQVVRFGTNALCFFEQNLAVKDKGAQSRPPMVLHCLLWMSRALIELSLPQMILGLYAWSEKNGGAVECLKYAARIANGNVELALDGLLESLTSKCLTEGEKKLSIQFILICLSILRSSSEMAKVQHVLGNDKNEKSKETDTPSGFEEEGWRRLKELANFDVKASKKNTSVTVPWSVNSHFESYESKLMEVAVSGDLKVGIKQLNRCLGDDAHMFMMFNDMMVDHTRASILHLITSAVKDSQKTSPIVINPNSLWRKKQNSLGVVHLIVGQQLNSWIEGTFRRGAPLKIFTEDPEFRLKMCRLARKTSNIRLAYHYNDFIFEKGPMKGLQNMEDHVIPYDRANAHHFVNGVGNWIQPRVFQNSQLEHVLELVKLYEHRNDGLKNKDGFKNSLITLLNAACDEVDRLICKSNMYVQGIPSLPPELIFSALSQQPTDQTQFSRTPSESKDLILLSRVMIKMAKLCKDSNFLLDISKHYCSRSFWQLLTFEGVSIYHNQPAVMCEFFASSLLSVSSKLTPKMSKAHWSFADWLYRLSGVNQEDPNAILLSKADVEAIFWTINNSTPDFSQEKKKILEDMFKDPVCFDHILSELSNLLGDNPNEQFLSKLPDFLGGIWKIVERRRDNYYMCSACSYFNYLKIYGDSSADHAGREKRVRPVIASLRILDLFVKRPEMLIQLVTNEVKCTNELLWKDITPQLFSRLNHPSPLVREAICSLLEAIAKTAPHLICYPAVVGMTHSISSIMDSENSDLSVEEINENVLNNMRTHGQDQSLMQTCCKRVASRLQQLYPEMMEEVSAFVKELQCINMLSEERWLFVLTYLDHEMSRRLSQIESEKALTLSNIHLSNEIKMQVISEKAVILASMTLQILEDLYERTCKKDSLTVNEAQFKDAYGDQLGSAIETFRKNRGDLKAAWQPFKQLLINITESGGRRSLVNLPLSDISPHLSQLVHTKIPMPGHDSTNFNNIVSIERFNKQLVILPTKTRPKRLALVGSDGKEYIFLFKGQEDLHLDERIMQFLRISNLILYEDRGNGSPYSAQIYSVTPFGPRSGFIQWVDGATSMFHVYRKWQQRQVQGKRADGRISNEVERPSELFFRKLKAEFEMNKIPTEVVKDRQKWPIAIVKKVFNDLVEQTPKDLLANELWLRAENATAWLRVVERFARSTAVMSILGSIIGLGDRHLDNILVNLESGQVVHIDYNVCFDKGQTLRVPETVPFRLTRNIIHALGPTQIEGIFRQSCEHVLEVLRKNKDVLLSLLDSFIYDPIVDWITSHDYIISNATAGVATILAVYGSDPVPNSGGELVRSLFKIRLKEILVAWHLNGERMHRALTRVANILEKEGMDQSNLSSVVQSNNRKERVSAGLELKASITEHHHFMSNIRPLLRSLALSDEEFARYLRFYKDSFSDPLVKGHKLLNDSQNDLTACVQLFRFVVENISCVYDNLMLLDKTGKKAELKYNSNKMPGSEIPSTPERCKQKGNSHAKIVACKMRMKLDGRGCGPIDVPTKTSTVAVHSPLSDDDKQLTTAEQVDLLIKQASSQHNLALIYEGWTAWV